MPGRTSRDEPDRMHPAEVNARDANQHDHRSYLAVGLLKFYDNHQTIYQQYGRMRTKAMTERKKVGFIGLGLMGRALARHTLQAGHPVTAFARSDRSREVLAALVADGASTAASPAKLADRVDIVVLCVTGAPEVHALVFGDDGLLAGAIDGGTVIDCSTSQPATSLACQAALASRGARFIDAAMTGTPSDAEAGAINLLLGGDPQTLASVEPLMRCWARNLFHCGPTGTGHAVKLLHQFVVLSNAAVLAEAFTVADRARVDPRVLGEVIASGGANSTAFQRLRPYVEHGDDTNFRFSIANARKDMDYYGAMHGEHGQGPGIGTAVLSTYDRALELGLGPQFVPHLIDAGKTRH